MTVSALYRYPVKSLGGEWLTAATLTRRGLAGDRRWMFVDSSGRFISRRTQPQLARFGARLAGDRGLEIIYRHTDQVIWRTDGGHPTATERTTISVWDDTLTAVPVAFPPPLLEGMGIAGATLVYMDDDSQRPVDPRYGNPDDRVSFADGYPYLIVGAATVADLSERMGRSVATERFRPNIVIEGADAGAEDGWNTIEVGGHAFRMVKACARCIMVDQNPQTGKRDLAVLGALSRYRKRDGKLVFGMNAISEVASGQINVGDTVTVLPPA